MFLAAIDPSIFGFVILALVIMFLGGILKLFKQPFVVAYIIAGILLGKHGFQIITNEAMIHSMGEIGLIILLFFIGMEISLPDLLKNWKVATFGTTTQIFASTLVIGMIGWFMEWNTVLIIVLGFVISLSSSAVVIKLLQDRQEIESQVGRNVISILLMQDILIVPMLITTSYLGGTTPSNQEIILQLVGGALIISTIIYIWKKGTIRLPFGKYFEKDRELQVFASFSICFGFALITAFFGLSAALGAFVGGMVVHAAQSTKWLHESLHAFQVLFVALFFVSVGMLIELEFLLTHWKTIIVLLVAVLLTNHFINASILRFFGRTWQESFYGGALLAQIGELSFVLIASAYYTEIIGEFAYQLTLIVISLSLLISPLWITMTQFFLKRKSKFSNAYAN